jgi:hypothetical protein
MMGEFASIGQDTTVFSPLQFLNANVLGHIPDKQGSLPKRKRLASAVPLW